MIEITKIDNKKQSKRNKMLSKKYVQVVLTGGYFRYPGKIDQSEVQNMR